MNDNTLLDENFPSCLRVVCNNRDAARATVETLQREASLEAGQVRVIAPVGADSDARKRVAASPGGTHPYLKFMLSGALLGALLGMSLLSADIHNLQSHRWLTVAACGMLGATLAYCLAGLVAWRRKNYSPLDSPPVTPEAQGYAVEVEVRDLPQQYVVRRVFSRLGVAYDTARDAGSCAAHDPG
jgi:hypothetical protein